MVARILVKSLCKSNSKVSESEGVTEKTLVLDELLVEICRKTGTDTLKSERFLFFSRYGSNPFSIV